MANKKLIKFGIIHALLTAIYIFLVALFFNFANQIFGPVDNKLLAPVVALLLFVVSALVTGSLVLGRPLMMYLDGFKKDAIKLLVYMGLSLFVIMIIVGVVLVIVK